MPSCVLWHRWFQKITSVEEGLRLSLSKVHIVLLQRYPDIVTIFFIMHSWCFFSLSKVWIETSSQNMLSANLFNNIIQVKVACLLSMQIHLQDRYQWMPPSKQFTSLIWKFWKLTLPWWIASCTFILCFLIFFHLLTDRIRWYQLSEQLFLLLPPSLADFFCILRFPWQHGDTLTQATT